MVFPFAINLINYDVTSLRFAASRQINQAMATNRVFEPIYRVQPTRHVRVRKL